MSEGQQGLGKDRAVKGLVPEPPGEAEYGGGGAVGSGAPQNQLSSYPEVGPPGAGRGPTEALGSGCRAPGLAHLIRGSVQFSCTCAVS